MLDFAMAVLQKVTRRNSALELTAPVSMGEVTGSCGSRASR